MTKFIRHRDLLFSTLAEITSLVIAGHDRKIIIERLLDCSLTVLDAERVLLFELDEEEIVKYSKCADASDGGALRIERFGATPGVRHWVIKEGGGDFRRGEELGIDLPLLATRYLDDAGPNRTIISAPLVAKRSMSGLLLAIHRDDGTLYSPEDISLITVLANHAAIAVENALLYQKLEMEAITDELTKVYNYRFLISSLESEIKRARRFGQTFSFVMLDVDNLKGYNDVRGHLCGSQALKEIAAIVKSTCREIDLVCKYGGDEFGILLPQTTISGAETVTRRVVDAVARHRFNSERAGLLTCSAGLSSFPGDGESVPDLIDAADKALYQAKRAGKNQVCTTSELIPESND